MSQKQTQNYLFPLIIVFIVCFLIGFITTMNNSMIEFCKEAFQLSDTQGQLVNTFLGIQSMWQDFFVFSLGLGILHCYG